MFKFAARGGARTIAAGATIALLMAQAARADVWVVTDDRVERLSAAGTVVTTLREAFGLPAAGRAGQDIVEIDTVDGSVWLLAHSFPAEIPRPIHNGTRVLHVAANGTPLDQFVLVGTSTGLAIDRGRGGVWTSRRVDAVDHSTIGLFTAPFKLVLIDTTSGAEKATIWGFSHLAGAIQVGADGAIWVQNSAEIFDPSFTRLTGTVEQLNGYDVSTPAGPHHATVNRRFNFTAEHVIDASNGNVWVPASAETGSAGDAALARLSPEGLLLRRFALRNFSAIAQLAVNSRDGSIWAADAFYPYDPQQPQKGANVAHYSANGLELATARHWGGMQGVTVDVTDQAAWVNVKFDIDPDELTGPDSVAKLDAQGAPIARVDYPFPERVIAIKGHAYSGQRTVRIDIAPSDRNNVVRPDSTDVVAVALLSSAWLDALQVEPRSLRFGTAGAVARADWSRDVNGDGRVDLVAQFRMSDTGVNCGDTQAPITGRTFGGASVYGLDRLRTAGCGTPWLVIATDIVPSDPANQIVPTPTAPIAVALLSTSTFDSTQANVSSLRFGRGGAAPRASWVRDVNNDGRADLVAQFRIGDALIGCGDTQVALSGQFAAQRRLYGVDRIVTVQCGF